MFFSGWSVLFFINIYVDSPGKQTHCQEVLGLAELHDMLLNATEAVAFKAFNTIEANWTPVGAIEFKHLPGVSGDIAYFEVGFQNILMPLVLPILSTIALY